MEGGGPASPVRLSLLSLLGPGLVLPFPLLPKWLVWLSAASRWQRGASSLSALCQAGRLAWLLFRRLVWISPRGEGQGI